MIIEYFSIASAIQGADDAAKASDVSLVNVRLGFAIGGKSYITLTGKVSAVEEAVKAGVKDSHYSIEFGSPKTIIGHDFPKKHNIDLIVVGATGLNAVERLLIGSVTEYVTRTSKCDVLVCRTEEIANALEN